MGPRFEDEFYGRAADRSAWSRFVVKGSVVRARRRYLDTRAPRKLESIRESLSREARGYLDLDVLVSARVPYGPLLELDEAIAREAMLGDVARMRTFAREMATHDLDGGVYRSFLGAVGAGLSLRLWASLYQNFWQPGRVVASSVGDAIHITLEDAAFPRYMCSQGFTGYIEQLLEIGRAQRNVEHRCIHDGHPACVWVVTPTGL